MDLSRPANWSLFSRMFYKNLKPQDELINRLLVSLVVLSLAAGMRIETVNAHANLRSARPGPGDTVTESPARIDLVFTEPVTNGQISLFNADSIQQLTSPLPVDAPEAVSTRVDETLPDGEYRVLWMVESGDGHPLSGSYNFQFDADAAAGEENGFSTLTWLLGLIFIALTVSGWWWLRGRILRATVDDEQPDNNGYIS